MNKKIICVLLIICILTLTGCNKKALSNHTFIMKIDELGFKQEKHTLSASEGIKSMTSATADANWKVTFYVFVDETKAQDKFKEFTSTFKDDYLTQGDSFTTSQDNYEKSWTTVDGKFKCASRIGATLILADVDEIHKTDVKKFIESLNY